MIVRPLPLPDDISPDAVRINQKTIWENFGRINRFTPVVANAQGFGAKGDGLTDDTTRFDAVLDYLSTIGGGILFVPIGTYMISSSLYIPSNVTIMGAGMASIIKSTPHTLWSDYGMLRFSAVSNCAMQDLVIDGNLSNQTTSEGRSAGIEIGNGANGLTFTRVISRNHQGNVAGNFGDGLYIGDELNGVVGSATPYNLRFHACSFTGNRRQGLSGIAGYDVKFYACNFQDTVSDNPGGGVDLEPDSSTSDFRDWLFDGCVFENNAYGIILNNAQQAKWKNIRLQGCVARKNRFDGINVQENDEGTTEIIDCYSEENKRNGLLFTASTNRAVKIRGGSFVNNFAYGIDIAEAGSRHIDIQGAHIYLNSLDGIRVGYVSGGIPNHLFALNRILNNGLGDITAAGSYHGVNFRGNATHTNFRSKLTGNIIGNRTEITEIYAWRQLNFQAAGYTSAVAGDIGKRVTGGTSGALGWLKGYDNALRRWMIQLISGTFQNGESVTLASTSETPVAGTGTGTLNAADTSYTLGATQRNGVHLAANCAGVEIFDNDFEGNINAPYVDTDNNSRKFLNRSDGAEFESFGVGTHIPDANLHVVNATSPIIEIGPAVGASRKSLRLQYRTSSPTDGASIWPIHAGTGNLAMEVGGSRIRLATSATGNVQDHSSNVRLDIQDAVVDVVTGDLAILTVGKGFKIKEGSGAKMGVSTLVNGTVTVSTTAILSTSRVKLTIQAINASTAIGVPTLGTVTNATSFVINARKADATVEAGDQSSVHWEIIDPA